jgi:hypothetical protein
VWEGACGGSVLRLWGGLSLNCGGLGAKMMSFEGVLTEVRIFWQFVGFFFLSFLVLDFFLFFERQNGLGVGGCVFGRGFEGILRCIVKLRWFWCKNGRF